MHEMGVVVKIVEIAEDYVRANNAEKALKMVLQIGQLSSVMPEAVRFCYLGAIENTLLSEAELEIEQIPANGMCKQCGTVNNLIDCNFRCMKCHSEEWEILSGRELIIKEIHVA